MSTRVQYNNALQNMVNYYCICVYLHL